MKKKAQNLKDNNKWRVNHDSLPEHGYLIVLFYII